MAQHPEYPDRRSEDAADRRVTARQVPSGDDAYDAATLGYEAADPLLQSPPWREAMQGAGQARAWQ